MDWQQIALIVMACLLAVAAVSLLMRLDSKQEERLKNYAKVAGWLREVKLPHSADMFACLAAKDFSGLVRDVVTLVRLLEDEKHRLGLLDDNFYYQLHMRLKRPEDRPKIDKAVKATEDADAAERQRTYESLHRDPTVTPKAPV